MGYNFIEDTKLDSVIKKGVMRSIIKLSVCRFGIMNGICLKKGQN